MTHYGFFVKEENIVEFLRCKSEFIKKLSGKNYILARIIQKYEYIYDKDELKSGGYQVFDAKMERYVVDKSERELKIIGENNG